MMWYGNWMGYGFGGFFMILFWVFIIALLLRIIRCSFGHGRCGHNKSMHYHCCEHDATNGAKEILEERFAKGEITKEQFEDMKKTLNTK